MPFTRQVSEVGPLIQFDKTSVLNGSGHRLLDEFDLSLMRGEVIALMSANHRECTAVLNVISGATRIPYGHFSSKAKRVSSTFRSQPLCPTLTASQLANVRATTRVNVRNLLHRLGMTFVFLKKISDLSPQEREIVGIIRCLCADADCYQLAYAQDELSSEIVDQLRPEFSSLAKAGKCVLLATDDARLARDVADRVVVLRDGKVAYDTRTTGSEEMDGSEIERLLRRLHFERTSNIGQLERDVRQSLTEVSVSTTEPLQMGRRLLEHLQVCSLQQPKFVAVSGGRFPLKVALAPTCSMTDQQVGEIVQEGQAPIESAADWQIRQVSFSEYTFHCCYAPAAEDRLSVNRLFLIFEEVAEQQHRSRLQRERLAHIERLDTVGFLAGGVAHDVNNSLGTIVLCTDTMLNRPNLPGDLSEHLTLISQASNRIGVLTRHLVDFSRKGSQQKSVFDLLVAVRNVVRLLQTDVRKNLSVNVHFECIELFVLGDQSQVENALINLGFNAFDAMETGGSLDIHVSGDSDSARISFTDQGSGMSPEVRMRAFEPFYTTKNRPSTGLGLASTEGIVSDHNGTVQIVRSDTQGTEIVVVIPRCETKQVAPVLESVPVVSAPVVSDNTNYILVVDDDHVLREQMVSTLEKFGFRTLSTSSAEQAIEIYRNREEEISLVLLDVVLPGMSGTDCYFELQRINAQAKILMMSGFVPAVGAIGDLSADGSVSLLRKPFSRAELSLAISKSIEDPSE